MIVPVIPEGMEDMVSEGRVVHVESAKDAIVENAYGERFSLLCVLPNVKVGDCGHIIVLDDRKVFLSPPFPFL